MSSNPASTFVAHIAADDVEVPVTGSGLDVSPQISAPDEQSPTSADPGRGVRTEVIIDHTARDLARAAAVAEAGSAEHIGDFLLAEAEDDIAVTAIFQARQPGYLGWLWSVTLAVLDEQHPTVSEVVLLPGDGALLAPAWIPWDERIRPGDLGPSDLLPPAVDDPRIVPAYLQSDDPAVEALATEVGLGRPRVLSREGRVDFAERLHDGGFGPADEVALAAPAHCVTCAFFLPLAGSLGALLGACGNDLSPADARVVDAGYGCGAHSETVIVMPARSAATDTVIDELALDVHRRPLVADIDLDIDVEIDVEGIALDEWTDPYVIGAEAAGIELAEAVLLDGDPADVARFEAEQPDDSPEVQD